MTNEEIKICFHVVNSVKGGSGKSTFSLLLADHFVRNGEPAYIIDLDVCGTSWNKDFQPYWLTVEKEKNYINQLMYQPCKNGFSNDVWSKLNVSDSNYGGRLLNVCVAAFDQEKSMYDKPEIELLEHATYHLIMDAQKRAHQFIEARNKITEDINLPSILHDITTTKEFVHKIDFILSKKNLFKALNYKIGITYLNNLNRDAIAICKRVNSAINDFMIKQANYEESVACDKYWNDKLKEIGVQEHKLSRTNEFDKIKGNIKLANDKSTQAYSNLQRAKDDLILANSEFVQLRKTIEYRINSVVDALRKKQITLSLDSDKIDDINKSIFYLEEKVTNEIYKESITAKHMTNKLVHVIFDLPPNHEKSVEQICQHLLFDQTSVLKKKLKENYKVCFYMMTPIDQPSAKEKNINYINNILHINSSYSSAASSFLSNKNFKVCFVVIDNHGLKYILDADPQFSVEKWGRDFDTKFIPFMRFAFKRNSYIGYTSDPSDTSKGVIDYLDLSGADYSSIDAVVDYMNF